MPRPTAQQGNLKLGFKRLKKLNAYSLDEKIEYANKRIAKALKKHKRPLVCWSGGKDSTVLLHLVLKQRPDIDVLFNDTGVEFPETTEFVSMIKQDWGIDNLHIAKPKRGETFWFVAKEHGWPIFGKEQSDNIERGRKRMKKKIANGDLDQPDFRIPIANKSNGNGNRIDLNDTEGFEKLSDMERVLVSHDIDISTRCCNFLKERPTKLIESQLDVDCKILGIMATESRRRTFLWIDHGDYYQVKHYFGKNKGMWKMLPMAIWTEQDVWDYHKEYNLPHCEIYNLGHDRNGCWTCGMGAKFGQFKRLRESHPQLFKYLMERTEMGRELLRTKVALNTTNLDLSLANEWAEDVDLSHLLLQKPCFFDKF